MKINFKGMNNVITCMNFSMNHSGCMADSIVQQHGEKELTEHHMDIQLYMPLVLSPHPALSISL